MRKVLLMCAVALLCGGWAQAQQASLFTGSVMQASTLSGSFSSTQIQYQTIVDKSPLSAPVLNQPKKATFYDKVYGRLTRLFRFPTIGSNPVLSVQSASTSGASGATVPADTFTPQLPFSQ